MISGGSALESRPHIFRFVFFSWFLVVQGYCLVENYPPQGGRRLLARFRSGVCPDGKIANDFLCNCMKATRDEAKDVLEDLTNTESINCRPLCGKSIPKECSKPLKCRKGIKYTCIRDGCGTHVSADEFEAIRSHDCILNEGLDLYACTPKVSVDIPTYKTVKKGICFPLCEPAALVCSFPARFGPPPERLGLMTREKGESCNGEEILRYNCGCNDVPKSVFTRLEETEAAKCTPLCKGEKIGANCIAEDDCNEVQCIYDGCTARLPAFVYEAIHAYKCQLLGVNRRFNCGPKVSVDTPGFYYATRGRCKKVCGMPTVESTCSFRARFGPDEDVRALPDLTQIALPPKPDAKGTSSSTDRKPEAKAGKNGSLESDSSPDLEADKNRKSRLGVAVSISTDEDTGTGSVLGGSSSSSPEKDKANGSALGGSTGEILSENSDPGSVVSPSPEAAEGTAEGTAAEGPAADGPAAEGLVADGPAAEGLVADGPTAEGPAVEGPAADGFDADGPAGEGPDAEGPADEGLVADGPDAEEPATEGPAADGPAAEGLFADVPAGEGPASEGPAADRFDADGPDGEGPASEGPAAEGPASDRFDADGPAGEGPAGEGPDAEGPDAEGPATEEPIADGPDAEGPAVEELVADGPDAEGPATEGPAAEGLVADGPAAEGAESDSADSLDLSADDTFAPTEGPDSDQNTRSGMSENSNIGADDVVSRSAAGSSGGLTGQDGPQTNLSGQSPTGTSDRGGNASGAADSLATLGRNSLGELVSDTTSTENASTSADTDPAASQSSVQSVDSVSTSPAPQRSTGGGPSKATTLGLAIVLPIVALCICALLVFYAMKGRN